MMVQTIPYASMILRLDRCAGSAEASLRYLYPKAGYDLCVDSCEASPAALAEMIIRSFS